MLQGEGAEGRGGVGCSGSGCTKLELRGVFRKQC